MKQGYERAPLYCKLAEEIEDKINKGIWPHGTKIPSERELVSMYGVSRITVRNAVEELAQQGKLEKVQGRGTFVASPSIMQPLSNVYSFSNEMKKQGKIASTKLVCRVIIAANKKLAEHLNIAPEDQVIYIERLRCAEGDTPILIERTYFPLKNCEFVLDIDLEKQSLYQTLEQTYNIRINRAVEVFKACELNLLECKQLNCRKKQFGLLVKRTSYMNDQIVCYSTIVSKGDSFQFTTELRS
jgi:GntR family transcriptional regulator